MNKKGFTLVELLAVVAILSILVIIALPNVMGMFNEAKKNSFIIEAKNIYQIAEQQYINDSMFNTSEREYSRNQTCEKTELELTGRSQLDYFIKFDKGGNVIQYYVSDGTYQFLYNGAGGKLEITDITDAEEVAKLENDAILDVGDVACNGNIPGGSNTGGGGNPSGGEPENPLANGTFYSKGTVTAKIGQPLPTTLVVYNDYKEMNRSIFLKYIVENNTITDMKIGIWTTNESDAPQYLSSISRSDPEVFTNNIDVIDSIFDNCDYIYSWVYECNSGTDNYVNYAYYNDASEITVGEYNLNIYNYQGYGAVDHGCSIDNYGYGSCNWGD